MNDKELFNEVLKNFADTYRLEIIHPYDDEYFELKKNGTDIGGFNPTGYNLLYNLKRLCKLLEQEL
ncbi:MAG: hypothetical protein IJZ79_02920 [Bacilli bacterium]|nr:hypothetical protein [Bacilli bacterium]MBQ8218678.1 hypothetical protein [Bacilli bacterium]